MTPRNSSARPATGVVGAARTEKRGLRSKAERGIARKLIVRGAIFLVVTLACLGIQHGARFVSTNLFPPMTSRTLLQVDHESVTCDGGFDQTVWLSVPLYFLIILYIFACFHLICDKHFIWAMEVISEDMDVSEDVAGATFLAAGSSSPELFSSALDTFVYKNGVGIGTIVGSAVFNILFGLGVAAIVAPAVHTLRWQSVLRDTIYFFIAILFVLVLFHDGEVPWFESLMLVCSYGIYVVHLVFNDRLLACLRQGQGPVSSAQDNTTDRPAHPNENDTDTTIDIGRPDTQKMRHDSISLSAAEPSRDNTMPTVVSDGDQEKDDELEDTKVETANEAKGMRLNKTRRDSFTIERQSIHAILSDEIARAEASGNDNWKQHLATLFLLLNNVYIVLETPARKWFNLTIPNCSRPETRPKWPYTFGVCLLYFIFFSWLQVMLGSRIGCITNMSPVAVGVTFLAVGTSVPDCLGGISAARNGFVGMSISNALGSNVFDICLAMGLPWFLNSLGGTPTEVPSDELVAPCVWMIVSAAVMFIDLWFHKWHLTTRSGYMYLVLYAVFIIYMLATD